ncbi:MAG: hypothetical protein IJU12_05165 [Clostridia bacterium]|nr:hypothetical protein [Clostridia bacterium]
MGGRIKKRAIVRPLQGIDKVDAPEENEGSFSSDCKFSCALGSAGTENLGGMKIPSWPGKRAFGNFLLGGVHAAACGKK